jgi:glycosyltransferase involved in cell wall biosynthesis
LNLQKNVIFTGIFTEQEMCERYHKFHVFVSSSIIKNESNSLSDAKLLGVPCVASFVGGVSDRLKHKVNVFLYQADTTYILAHYLCKIFGNNALSLKFSLMAKQNALKTYNKEENLNKLLEIYKNITNGST